MNVTPDGNQYTLDIDIDGYQTMERIRAVGKVEGQSLRIFFQSIRQDHIERKKYLRGDVLLELSKVNGRVLTKWRSIEPELEQNKKDGVYFERSSSMDGPPQALNPKTGKGGNEVKQ